MYSFVGRMKVAGIDFDGTNLRIGDVDRSGNVSDVVKYRVADFFSQNKMYDAIKERVSGYDCVGVSAVGSVDGLVIRDFPNSLLKGDFDFPYRLNKSGIEIDVTESMSAAVRGIKRFGQGQECDKVLVANYSLSDFGCAYALGDKIIVGDFGRQRYVPVDASFDGIECGCGGVNRLESFVTGDGAVNMVMKLMDAVGDSILTPESALYGVVQKRRGLSGREDALRHVSARDIFAAFMEYSRSGFERSNSEKSFPHRQVVGEQVLAVANSLAMMNAAYTPDIMVLMGRQTDDWDVLFEPAIEAWKKGDFQKEGIKLPEVVKCDMKEPRIVGAALPFL